MNYVVITTINPPTPAVEAWAALEGWKVVVVGDRKTPDGWALPGVTYLSFEEQLRGPFARLAAALPANSYVRKMIGYAHAIRDGATAILDTDDDNEPLTNAFPKRLRTVRTRGAWVNPHPWFGSGRSWPRGFPLSRVSEGRRPLTVVQGENPTRPKLVTQYLADGDPDVDAVWRMTVGRGVEFQRGRPTLELTPGSWSPINSQATLWKRGAFPLMFLPVGVPDRVTDILRGYLALSCLWGGGSTARLAGPLVFQSRNAHDLRADLRAEMTLYTEVENWAELLGRPRDRKDMRAALELFVGSGDLPAANLDLYDIFKESMT